MISLTTKGTHVITMDTVMRPMIAGTRRNMARKHNRPEKFYRPWLYMPNGRKQIMSRTNVVTMPAPRSPLRIARNDQGCLKNIE